MYIVTLHQYVSPERSQLSDINILCKLFFTTLVYIIVFYLIQGAGCAIGIHEVLQNMTHKDERKGKKRQ